MPWSLLMAVDALLPAGGELVMLYAGVLAAGVLAHHATVLGIDVPDGLPAYLVVTAAGALGYLAGSLAGWAIGVAGGRPLVERHGRWLHLGPERLARAERWFVRFGGRAVFLGGWYRSSARSSPSRPACSAFRSAGTPC